MREAGNTASPSLKRLCPVWNMTGAWRPLHGAPARIASTMGAIVSCQIS